MLGIKKPFLKNLLISLSLLVLSFYSAGAYERAFINNAGGIDSKSINFGFLFSFGAPRASIANKPDFAAASSNAGLMAVSSELGTALSAGFLIKLRVTPHFSFMLSPQLDFVNRSVNYTYLPPSNYTINCRLPSKYIQINKRLVNTYMHFPMLMQYKGERLGSVRPYVSAGVLYSVDLRSKNKYNLDHDLPPNSDDRFIKLRSQLWSWNLGLGMEIYTYYFKLTPEISYNKSFNSVLDNGDENKFTRPIASVFNEVVRLTLYFE